ncbi:MAG: exonuclease SbcCD subunit D C-terminal domain-containing protein [Aureispira sp.]
MLNVLHTADWHLGQKLFHKTRKEEHKAALDWLLELVVQQNIELLIIAGDIFDTDNPPNYARQMYYDFLQQLQTTPCQSVVVVAGNHDSANMLDATKKLLGNLSVFVVGNIPEDRTEQIIPIRHPKTGVLQAVVAAVPYLRDRDVRQSVAGEDYDRGIERLKAGIHQHYEEIAKAIAPYATENVPLMVTGHLYAAGGERGERPDIIHIGHADVISTHSFSKVFDYVALGHLHRPQQLDKPRPIWYSGSLIPLDFSELNYSQSVRIIEFGGKKIAKSRNVPVPLIRKLRTFKGSVEKIKNDLHNLSPSAGLDTWLRLEIETDIQLPHLQEELEEILADKPAEIMQLKLLSTAVRSIDTTAYQQLQSLDDLEAIDVFRLAAQQGGALEEEALQQLENSFKELLSWMQERPKE